MDEASFIPGASGGASLSLTARLRAGVLRLWGGQASFSLWAGGAMLLLIALPCVVTLPWSLQMFDHQQLEHGYAPPSWQYPFGADTLGRSLLWRCLLGGAISLSIGLAAALVSVVIGSAWGAIAGYAGGRVDALMMRIVDVLYGLPYILLVVLIDIAFSPVVKEMALCVFPADTASGIADVLTLLLAIGGVSWLTLARVVRGQVLSLRAQPFVEAARALGIGPVRIMFMHLLPNLIGPIVVYTTLTVPSAILQESLLSFLGIGIQAPLPSWGNLASEGIGQLHALGQAGMVFRWWLIVWPCVLLGVTLLALNFLGDALRVRLDPRRLRG